MRRQSVKMILMGGAIALVVIFGIDLASSGVERINGPLDDGGASPAGLSSDDGGYAGDYAGGDYGYAGAGSREGSDGGTKTIDPADRAPDETQRVVDAQHGRRTDWDRLEEQRREELRRQLEQEYAADRLPGVPDTRSDTGVNKLADGTAGLLQSMSSKGIRMIVSLFESVTD